FAWAALQTSRPTGLDYILLIALGLICTALAHTLFIASLRAVSAHVASVVAALEPVYGIALAWLLIAEVPSVRVCVGAALLVAAAITVGTRSLRAAKAVTPL